MNNIIFKDLMKDDEITNALVYFRYMDNNLAKVIQPTEIKINTDDKDGFISNVSSVLKCRVCNAYMAILNDIISNETLNNDIVYTPKTKLNSRDGLSSVISFEISKIRKELGLGSYDIVILAGHALDVGIKIYDDSFKDTVMILPVSKVKMQTDFYNCLVLSNRDILISDDCDTIGYQMLMVSNLTRYKVIKFI